MTDLCVIFDLDGTLVNSEPLCNQAFVDLIPQVSDTVDMLTKRYRGMKLAVILADLESRLEISLPSGFEAHYRDRVEQLFAESLKPMPGVDKMLSLLSYPFCVASSGPARKIHQELSV